MPHSRKAAGGKRLSHRAIVTPQRSSQLLRGHVVAQLDLAVGIVHEDQLGPVLGHVGLMHLGKGRNDQQITHGSTARGRAVDRDHAAAALALPAIKAVGGQILARGLPLQTYEQGQSERVVVIEFDSLEAARSMHDGADYQDALAALADGAECDIRINETV